MASKKSAYVVLTHGSRDEEANEEFRVFLGRLQKNNSSKIVEGCFLGFAEPTVPQSLQNLYKKGIRQFTIIPLMFFSGRHIKEDIPQIVADFKLEYPDIDFHIASPIAHHPQFFDLVGSEIGNS